MHLPVFPAIGSVRRRLAAARSGVWAFLQAASMLALTLALGAALPVRADTVLEGVRFEDRAAVSGRELVLNGVGLRAAGWFKLYVAALYVPQRASTAEQVIAQAGAKRVRVVMLREAPAVELAKAVHKDFAEKLQYARVWNAAGLDGLRVNRDYVLADEDVVELHI